MDSVNISLGENMELRPRLSDGSYSANTFTSKIQDVLSEKEFLILPPSDQDLDSWIGCVFQVTVVQEKEAFVGVVQVEKTVADGNLNFLHMTFTENLKLKQRRNFYRLKIGLTIEIAGHGTYKTYDISANGLAFVADKKFMKNETLAITLHIMDDLYPLYGIVVRCSELSEKEILVSIHFSEIGEMLQDEIAKFIHAQQFVLMKKGVLQR